jgi:hypothetical protein
MMANGTLVRTLIHTDVTKNLSFKAVDGSYVFSKGKVYFSIYALPFFLLFIIIFSVGNSLVVISVFRLLLVSSLAYPNLFVTKRLSCCWFISRKIDIYSDCMVVV